MEKFKPPYIEGHEHVEDSDLKFINLPSKDLLNPNNREVRNCIARQRLTQSGYTIRRAHKENWLGDWRFVFGLFNDEGTHFCGIYIGASIVDYQPILYTALNAGNITDSGYTQTDYLFLENNPSCHAPIINESVELHIAGEISNYSESKRYAEGNISAEFELSINEKLVIPITLEPLATKLSF